MILLLGTCSSLLGTSSSLLGTCPTLLGTSPLLSNTTLFSSGTSFAIRHPFIIRYRLNFLRHASFISTFPSTLGRSIAWQAELCLLGGRLLSWRATQRCQ